MSKPAASAQRAACTWSSRTRSISERVISHGVWLIQSWARGEDAQGAPQTDFNVSLPWSRTVVMNPGVQLRSVVATSLTGHLNCSIIDGAGQPVSMSTSNAMIATCSR